MSRPAYPKYKPSGIEWLGDVPLHWGLQRFKYVLWLQRGHDLPVTEFDENGSFPVCGSNGCIGVHSKFTTKGPGVTVGRSGSVGEVNYIDGDFWAHNTALYVKEFRAASPKFAFYLLKSLDTKYLSQGTAVGTLNRNNIHQLLIATPSLSEQRAIAAFLDRETGRIDALIGKKERQIELLREKRAALISHVVTKGLDPNAPMKDSGIEWLGDVPEHWETRRLKYTASVNDEVLPESTEADFEIHYVDIGSVDAAAGIQSKETMRFENAPSRARRIVRDGDVIVSTVRTYLRAIAPIVNPEEGLTVSTGFAVIRPRKDMQSDFAAHALRAPYFVEAVVARSVGVSYPAVNATDITDLRMAFPPVDEQRAIAAFLDRETGRIDAIIEKAQTSIDKLREYRTALISAAVTGKIDVRKQKG